MNQQHASDIAENRIELTVRVADVNSSALAALRVFVAVLTRLRRGVDSSGKSWLCVRGKEPTEERA